MLPPCSLSLCLSLSRRTTACGIPWQQIWLRCHMGEISQTKTSIECSLYSPIPAVAAPAAHPPNSPPRPNAQTLSHTQFNRSLSRQSAKRLLSALSRPICNALFFLCIAVTFPAAHTSCQAMGPPPVCRCEGDTSAFAGSVVGNASCGD